MTQDEIIRMALEAGFGHSNFHNGFQLLAPSTICTNLLTRFAALVAAHEREACAKVCDEMYRRDGYAVAECEAADECAAAIRARSQIRGKNDN